MMDVTVTIAITHLTLARSLPNGLQSRGQWARATNTFTPWHSSPARLSVLKVRLKPPIPGGTRAGYEYQAPKHGVELMGWRIKATFPTGPRNELRWHDGFVFGCTSMEREEGGTVEQYTIFFPIDMGCITAHAPFNDKSICFRKQNLPDPKVSEREMARARAAQAQGEAQDEE